MKTQSLISSLATVLLLLGGCDDSDEETPASDTENATTSSEPTGAGSSGTDSNASTNSGPATSTEDSSSSGDPGMDSTDPSAGSGSSAWVGCRHVCEQDSDCLFQGGLDTGLRCGEAGYCTFTCSADTDCAAAFSSNPQMPCSTNAECIVSELCLDRGDGEGACTFIPNDIECPRGLAEVDVVDIEGNPTTICGTEMSCLELEDGTRSCGSNTGCLQDGCGDSGLTCGDDGVCFCTADEDCSVAGDTCTDGVCSFSCDSAQECEDVPLFANFEGGTLVCEGG